MNLPKPVPNPNTNISLTLKSLCNEVESHYHFQIRLGSAKIVSFLQSNAQIESLTPSVSELVHIIYYKLRYEMKQCFLKEKKTLFPLVIEATPKDILQLQEVTEPIRKAHEHILELTRKLRLILCQYETPPHYSQELKNFINEISNLEHNICKWILVEEDLIFPKVFSDLAKAKFIATVFR